MNDGFVQWRLDTGECLCHVCPLNGQRKVGASGDPKSAHILVGEGPGADEENYDRANRKHGLSFQGNAGRALKVNLMAPAGLAKVEHTVQEGAWPVITEMDAFLPNVIMCRPPKNKIDSPVGKKAQACCRNSLILLLRKLEEENPKRGLQPLGNAALRLMMPEVKGRKYAIGKYRGRVLWTPPKEMELWSTTKRLKIALRGVKPPEEWKTHLMVIKKLIALHRKWARKSEGELTPAEMVAMELAKVAEAQAKLEKKAILAVGRWIRSFKPRRKPAPGRKRSASPRLPQPWAPLGTIPSRSGSRRSRQARSSSTQDGGVKCVES